MAACLFIGAASIKASAVFAEESGFSMQNGAYVKVSGEEKGIRFVTDITEEKYASLAEGYGEENLEFGTLFLPTSLVTDETSLTIENVASETNEKGAAQVVVDSWVTYAEETTVRSFVSALTDIPESRYGAYISARSYVLDKTTGEIIEYTDVSSRSVAGVALAGYADENVKDEQAKQTLMDSYLSGSTFAGLTADKIGYNALKTSLLATEDGKISVTESGTGRAWNNVMFRQGCSMEAGKTYYFSFDISISADTDCDLFLGAITSAGNRLNIHHEQGPYKKLASGTITATFRAEENCDDVSLFIFSNADAADTAYSYGYTVDNFKAFCTDYESAAVADGKYTVKLSNSTGDNPTPEYTEFTRETEVLTENAVGTITAKKITGWQGAFVDFGTLEAGIYNLSFKVYNASGEAVYLYTRQFKDNVQSGLKDFNSVENGATVSCTATLTFTEATDYMIRVFSANNGGKALVKFEIGELTLTRSTIANTGTLGGYFEDIKGTNGTTLEGNVADESLYNTNVIGTAACGEGGASSWRGISLTLKKTATGGKYVIRFTVTNRTANAINLYSQATGNFYDEKTGNFNNKVSEHGSLAVGEKKAYTIEITADDASETGTITFQVFSMTAAGHSFELGDISVDFTANA